MKCKSCGRMIKSSYSYCSFCGLPLPKRRRGERAAYSKHYERRGSSKAGIAFIILAVVIGGLLGFAYAKGIVTLDSLIPGRAFEWTSFSDADTEADNVLNTSI